MNAFMTWGVEIFSWVLQTTWQASVLAVLILLTQWLFGRRLSPGWRYGLWMLLVIRLIMPASLPSDFSLFNWATLKSPNRIQSVQHAPEPLATRPGLAIMETAAAPAPADSPAFVASPEFQEPRAVPHSAPANAAPAPAAVVSPKRQINWLGLGFFIWLTGACVCGTRLVWVNVRFILRLSQHVPVSDPEVTQLFRACRMALGVRQTVILVQTGDVSTPGVYGFRRKRLLLPEGFCDQFSCDELRHIFLHELAHLKRRDLEINWLVTVLQVVHWFNPVLWVAFARMQADRELATDDLALAHTAQSENTSYGETILKVLERLRRDTPLPGVVGIVESKEHVKERFQAIVDHGTGRPWKWAALGIVLAMGALTLTDATTRAQTKPNPSESAPEARASAAPDRADAPNPSKRFSMRIIDFDTLAPMSGVTVKFEFAYYSDGSNTQERLTGADGKVAIAVDPASVRRFAYHAGKPGYLSLHGEWLRHQIALVRDDFEVKLSPGIEIGGMITDDKQTPLKGAEIFFDRPINMMLNSDSRVDQVIWKANTTERLAVSDSAGTWKARCIWPTMTWAALRIRHPHFADAVYSTEITRAMETEGKGHALEFEELSQHRARFALAPGIALSGRVLDSAGAGMPGVQVRYADRPSENPFGDSVLGKGTVTTDATGKFRIGHLPSKRIYFTVQLAGHAPTVGEIDLSTSTPEIELRAVKGEKLAGQVRDNEGEPVAGARLSFQDWSLWQGVRWESITDDNGRFRWDNAPTEKFQLLAEKEGFISQRKILQGGTEPVIRLNRTLNIVGKVLAADTRKPIDHFRILWADREEYLPYNRSHALVGSNGIYSLDLARLHESSWVGGYSHDFIFRIEADGYVSATSRSFSSREGDVGKVTYDLELQPADSISGTIMDAVGRPVAGAQIVLKTPASRLRLAGKPEFEKLDAVIYPVTDHNGHFRISKDPEATRLIAVHTEGIAWVETNDLATNSAIRLQSWGKIEGTVWEYDQPLASQEVWLSSPMLNDRRPGIPFIQFSAKTDGKGHFKFDFVPPTKCSLYRMIPIHRGAGSGPRQTLQIKPGETTTVKIGGDGRPMNGRFKVKNPYVEIDWRKDHHSVSSVRPKPPAGLKTAAEYEAWRKQPEIERALDQARNHPVHFAADGSFRIDEVIPGKYQFDIQIHDPRDANAFAYSRYLANFGETFEVPASNEPNSRKPLDLGVFELALKPQIEEGKTPAPEFLATDMSGKEFKLADFRGKYVVLDFWATWCGPCIAELPYRRKAYEKYGGRDDFVMVSLSLDKTIAEAREFVKSNNMLWVQGYLGEWSSTDVPEKYGLAAIPAIFLVNPEGKIIANELKGGSLNSHLEKWLK